MKLNTNIESRVDGSVTGHAVAAALTQEQIIVLALKQYSAPFLSAFKELVSNAVDAHKDAGIYSTPVDIYINEDVTTKTITYVFRDYGLGMSKEFLEHGYFSIGNSTKRDDENQTGAFGLGAKAALAFSPTMRVTCYDGTQSHTVIGQLVEGRQIVCSKVISEPSSELRGTRVEFTQLQTEITQLARPHWSSSDLVIPRTDLLKAIQATAVVGFHAGVDNAPRVTVTSNASYAEKKTANGEPVMHVFNRNNSDSLLTFVKSHPDKINAAGGLVITNGLMENPIENVKSRFSELSQFNVVWHDSFYNFPASLIKYLEDLKFQAAGRSVSLKPGSYGNQFLFLDPLTVFDISSDRGFINDTESNRIKLAKIYKRAVVQLYGRLIMAEVEFGKRLEQINPLGVEAVRGLEAVLDQRMLASHMDGQHPNRIYESVRQSARNICGNVTFAVYDSYKKARFQSYGERSKDLRTDEEMAPLALVVPLGINKQVKTLVNELGAESDKLLVNNKIHSTSRVLKIILMRTNEDNVDAMVAKARQVFPPYVRVASLNEEARRLNIDLDKKAAKCVVAGKVKKVRTGASSDQMILIRSVNHKTIRDFTQVCDLDASVFELCKANGLPTDKFTYIRIKGFEPAMGSWYYTYPCAFDQLSALFGRQCLFVRSGVDVDELASEHNCEIVEGRQYILQVYRENLRAARQLRFDHQLLELADYLKKSLDYIRKADIDIEQLLWKYYSLEFSKTVFAELKEAVATRKTVVPLPVRTIASLIGDRRYVRNVPLPRNVPEFKGSDYSYIIFNALTELHDREDVAARRERELLTRYRRQFNYEPLTAATDKYLDAQRAKLDTPGIGVDGVLDRVRDLVDHIKSLEPGSKKTYRPSASFSRVDWFGNNTRVRKLLESTLAGYFAWVSPRK